MSLMSFLFGGDRDDVFSSSKPVDPEWRRSPRGLFYRLVTFKPGDLGLSGVGGVFVIWHGGVRPAWVSADKTADLAVAIEEAQDNPDVNRFESHGGLYISWTPIKPEFRDGVVKYLRQIMDPLVDSALADGDIDEKAKPIAVHLPGKKKESGPGKVTPNSDRP